MRRSRHPSRHVHRVQRRRGSAVLIVLWAMALGAIIVSSVQLLGYRHATLGQQSLGRVQARWAARGGLEQSIAVMAIHTQYPVVDDALAMVRELETVASDDYEVGRTVIASYDIRHHVDGVDFRGPLDEHSRINVNATLSDPSLLIAFEDMTPDLVDALHDWLDADDEPRPQGAEKYWYQGVQTIPYQPRNGNMRNIMELELVAGFWPENVRGEDWNINNKLDDNENDGERSWPIDDLDDVLHAGWKGFLTTHSVRGGTGPSGLPKLYLRDADPEEVMERLDFEEELANQLIEWAGNQQNTLEALLVEFATPAPRGGRGSTGAQQGQQEGTTLELSRDELITVLAETTLDEPGLHIPGKLNINTVSEELLRKLFFTKEHLVDEIAFLRARPNGISSMVEVAEVPAFADDLGSLEYVARTMDVSSNVYTVTARGRAWGGNTEIEIIAVVDRSALPIRILEYREQ